MSGSFLGDAFGARGGAAGQGWPMSNILDAVEQLRALDDAFADFLPLSAGNEQWQTRERPCALARLAMNSVRDAHIADASVGSREALVDFFLPDEIGRAHV